MPVTKRVRFEVLRRDGHRCRYCGVAAADGARLTIDHVVPTALGGSDDPDNLVAACDDCNAGKTSTTPDGPLVADVAADALRWARAREAATAVLAAAVEDRARYRDAFLDGWHEYDKDGHWLPTDWLSSVSRWQEIGLPIAALVEAVDIAMGSRVPATRVFTYVRPSDEHQAALITRELLDELVADLNATRQLDPDGT